MKLLLGVLLTVILGLTACTAPEANIETPPVTEAATPLVTETAKPLPKQTETPPVLEEEPEPFPGKIAFITQTFSANEEEPRSAQQFSNKYGEDKVVHVTWPDKYMEEQEQMVEIVAEIALDPDVHALIIGQTVPGTNAAIDKLLETRDDIFIVYCFPQENPADVVERANLSFVQDDLLMGTAMAKQAEKLGAKTFVHYSFPRHMSQPILSERRERIKEECENLGIQFVDEPAPDPQDIIIVPGGRTVGGMYGAQQYVLEDVPKILEKYGKDTAFFSTNCGLQIPLIKSLVDGGGIYPQSCCPSPYHGFPGAFDIEWEDFFKNFEDEKMINETRKALEEKDMLGRISTWPVSIESLMTNAGAEYAIKWINGEVPKEGIDLDMLKQCMKDYAGVDCFLRSHIDEDGTEYKNFLLVLEDYLVY